MRRRRADGDRRGAGRERPWTLILCLVLVGIGGLLLGRPLADALARVLPLRVTVASAGTTFPGFAEGYGFSLWSLGFVVLGAAFAACLPWDRITARATRSSRRTPMFIAAGIAASGGLLVGFLSYPHNAYPSNARIHWVDNLFSRSDFFFYALVKFPFLLFYDYPHVLAALCAVLDIVLAYAIARTLFKERWIAPLASVSVLVSGFVLLFATSAEDAFINVTVLMLVGFAAVRKRWLLLGLFSFLAVLGRPQFVVIIGALFVAELVRPERTAPARDKSGFLSRTLASVTRRAVWLPPLVFTLLFGAWQAWLVARGDQWLWADGQLIASPLVGVTPSNIDGYVISPLDGAYTSHWLWIVPTPILAAHVIAVVRWRSLTGAVRHFLVLTWLFSALSLLVSEVFPIHYVNVRYFVYPLPFVLIGSWAAITGLGPRVRRTPAIAAAAVVLLLAPAAVYPQWIIQRQRVAERPLARAFEDRGELRELVDGREVTLVAGSKSQLNYLSYLLKRPFDAFARADAEPESWEKADVVVFTADPPLRDLRVLYRDNGLTVGEPDSS